MSSKSANLLAAAFLLPMIAAHAWAASLRVEIQSPKKNQEVGVETMVTGTVSDPQTHVYVLVRPLRTKFWWVQRPPSPPARDGNWQTLGYFGTPTEGNGEPYEIIAIAANKRLDLKEGQKLEDVPDLGVRSDVITVKRAP
jgi:hypothetical protein